MAEHHTQGRQGQGARRRRNYRTNRNHRQRMPKPEEPKPSFLKRMLSIFGIGRKKQPTAESKAERSSKGVATQATQRVRVAQSRTPRSGAGTQAAGKQRRSATIPPPTAHSTRLYVGNLSFESTEPELEELFKGFGHVRKVEVVYNSRTYRSKGFAFVEMETEADAKRATEVLNGQPFMGREMRVCAAGERKEHERSKPQEGTAGVTDRPQEEEEDVTTENADFGEETVVNLPEVGTTTPEKTRQD